MSQLYIPALQFIESPSSGFTAASILNDVSSSIERYVVSFSATGNEAVWCNFITPPDMDTNYPEGSFFTGKSAAPSSGNCNFVLSSPSSTGTWYLTGGLISNTVSPSGIVSVSHSNIPQKFGILPYTMSGLWGPDLYVSCPIARRATIQNDTSTYTFHVINACFNYTSSLVDKGYIWIPSNSLRPLSTGSVYGYTSYSKPWYRTLPKNLTLQTVFPLPIDYNGSPILRVYFSVANSNTATGNINFTVNLSRTLTCDSFTTDMTTVTSGTVSVNNLWYNIQPCYIDLDLSSQNLQALDNLVVNIKRNNNGYDTYTGNVLIEGCYFIYNRSSYKQNMIFIPTNFGGSATTSVISSGSTYFWASEFSNTSNNYIEIPALALSYLYKRNPVIKIKWKSNYSGLGLAAFKAYIEKVTLGSDIIDSYNLESSLVLGRYNGKDVLNETSISLSNIENSLSPGDLLYIKLYRLSSIAEDNIPEPIYITHVIFEYDTR